MDEIAMFVYAFVRHLWRSKAPGACANGSGICFDDEGHVKRRLGTASTITDQQFAVRD